MSDGIIDIGDYLRRRDGEDGEGPASTFSLWGADGEKSRFALPLWRAIYLAQGERGGVLSTGARGEDALRPFVVLDLAAEPARLDFPWDGAPGQDPDRVPDLVRLPDEGLRIQLGQGQGRRWFLQVSGGHSGTRDLVGRDREDVLFLAGECAGLLFLRGFADEPEP